MQLQYYGAVEHQGTTRLGFGKKRRRSNNNAANQHSAAWRRKKEADHHLGILRMAVRAIVIHRGAMYACNVYT
jgi:hypothetical protein